MQMRELVHMITPFQQKLYRYALRIVGDHMEAEDVIQELLIKIWKKKDQFLAIDNKEAWCMTLTRNMSIDKTRKKKKHRASNIEDFYFIKDSSSTPYQSMESQDNMSKLQSIISGLTEKQQTVIHLRDVEGYSYKEISEITGYTVDQIKVYLHRARMILRKQINRSDYE